MGFWSLVFILFGMFGSWSYVDLESTGFVGSFLMPIMFFLFLVGFFLWVAIFIHNHGLGGSDGEGVNVIDE